jgi:uncharacterized protein (TIGR03437 family)
VATSLGAVQVLFVNPYNTYPSGTVLAPLTYVGASQINCVVPYEVEGWGNVVIETTYLGVLSSTAWATHTINILEYSPAGIFTATGTGTGQAAALNSDNSVNSSSNPAPAGSTVQVFMTGEGQTSPAGVTGSVTCFNGCASVSAIPAPVAKVSATVNGQAASVAFAGEAPGLVAGVAQINVVIPPNTPSGPASLSIYAGGAFTQAGITIAVK